MQLYIPEIGDTIMLTQDWEFELHAERRNEQLAAFFGHYLTGYGRGLWLEESSFPRLRKPEYNIEYPDREDPKFRKMFGRYDYSAYDRACEEAKLSNPEYLEYQRYSDEWYATAKSIGKPVLIVRIPAGTTLSIDRIYIRKGASEFSSITFYAKGLGEVTMNGSRFSWGNQKTVKRKAQRFWAKLEDCNKIQFEKV
jgi:hypothetical protein